MLHSLAKQYYKAWIRFTNLKKKAPIFLVDFNRPWWYFITERIGTWVLICSGVVAVYAFTAITPQLLTYIFKKVSLSYFFIFIVVWVLIEVWEFVMIFVMATKAIQIIESIQYSTYRFFLTVDPVYHTTRASGELFGKTERALRAYDETIDVTILEFLPITVRLVTVVFSFFFLSFFIGSIMLILMTLLATLSIALVLFNGLAFEQNLIYAEDRAKDVSLETLQQIQLIRSSFSTNEWNYKIYDRNSTLLETLGSYWVAFWTTTFVSRFAYTLSVICIGWGLLSLVSSGELDPAFAVAFLISYVTNTYKVIRIGRKIQKINQAVIRINDLFSFIRNFGKQTFPVLTEDEPVLQITKPIEKDTISVSAEELYFAYPSKAQIFDGHSLELKIAQDQKNKLYGIIGPSGVGKTTLASILGGQLHPTLGTVEINKIPIYEVNDITRRKLIAIQGQVASSISGNVKDNLLLGIPKEEAYTDKQLIEVLYQVGLWRIFKEKEGLYSEVGEGGLNLSVGQRQRLNFASLYLRATYFKPDLLIIDEPTSSLDEVSEHAITNMIDQLAQHALTLVIAHRLKTLQEAVAILDLSLVAEEKEMIFYPKDELAEKSVYYQQLIKGEVPIEE